MNPADPCAVTVHAPSGAVGAIFPDLAHAREWLARVSPTTKLPGDWPEPGEPGHLSTTRGLAFHDWRDPEDLFPEIVPTGGLPFPD
jgi:hypothetical protein